MKNMSASKTVVVLGMFRGGTSMVSGVLKILGVPMGDTEDRGQSYEDGNFISKGIPRIKELIATRNERHTLWGWKDPGSIDYIRKVKEDLVNPHYIIVFRDAYAIAKGSIKRAPHQPLANALCNAMNHTCKLIEFTIDFPKEKILILSYEKCIVDKEKMVTSILTFLDLNVSESVRDRACKFIEPGDYRSMEGL